MLKRAYDAFELAGNGIPGKFFCAFINWFGHIISDMSGLSGHANWGQDYRLRFGHMHGE